LSFLLTLGCQPAVRYTPPTPTETARTKTVQPPPDASKLIPVNPDLGWQDSQFNTPQPTLPIEIVHPDRSRSEWERLPKQIWHLAPLFQPAGVATLIGLNPYTSSFLAVALYDQPFKLRVPLGLPDPTESIPAGNPLTLAKWELGRQLFFDPTWLTSAQKISCASCHKPGNGFTDRNPEENAFKTPTLLNCVYNKHQFWDGRATHLEEVVQRTLEDERDSASSAPFRHVWGGVIGRLDNSPSYRRQFQSVFACPPTQDTLGRALATYLRTLLCGDSLYDRARKEQANHRGPTLDVADYEKVIPAGWAVTVGREGKTIPQVAAELHRGYQLFYNLDRNRPANCVLCHPAPLFSDGGFYNLGVGFRGTSDEPLGRFAHVPVGHKTYLQRGAWKTPSLRSLGRTGPYFHNGSGERLEDVIEFHAAGGRYNSYLALELRDPLNPLREWRLGLASEDVGALALFLQSLNGQDVDPILKTDMVR